MTDLTPRAEEGAKAISESGRTMRIMVSDDFARRLKRGERIVFVRNVPWELFGEAGERASQINHTQSLDQISRRGGFDAVEAVCVLTGMEWQQGRSITEDQAHRILYAMTAFYRRGVLAAEARAATAEAEVERLQDELARVNNEFGSMTADWPQAWKRVADLKQLSGDRWQEVQRLKSLIADYEEAMADKHRLARQIDVAMHGEEGAARQPSLCDLVGPASSLRDRVARLEEALKPFCFGDPVMDQILFGGMPDSATCNLTVRLGDTRAARTALQGASDVKP